MIAKYLLLRYLMILGSSNNKLYDFKFLKKNIFLHGDIVKTNAFLADNPNKKTLEIKIPPLISLIAKRLCLMLHPSIYKKK